MTKRWALAGTGHRGLDMFARPLATHPELQKGSELVGLFDPSRVHLEYCRKAINKPELPIFTDFDAMLDAVKPDGVIVCTVDTTHAEYIRRAAARGCMVASEKPVCVTEQQCADLLRCEKETGSRIIVTHNVRFMPLAVKIKELIDSGAIGEIKTMHYREMLDRDHGAAYFRRWHARRKNSGGLMTHKSSHHFDILNFFNGGVLADTVSALGDLSVYGKNGPYRSDRCRGCPHATKCEFYTDITPFEKFQEMYIKAEDETGYVRDNCVFAEDIDIEDRISVSYRYKNGVIGSYTLCAYAMWEGAEIHIQGTDGLIEAVDRRIRGEGIVPDFGIDKSTEKLTLYTRNAVKSIEIPQVEGGHGGADAGLHRAFFGDPSGPAKTAQTATLFEALQAVLIGLAANRSIQKNGAPESVQAPIAGI